MICPLCKKEEAGFFSLDLRRNYWRCAVCGLVFVPSSQFLSAEKEKQRYDLHQNSFDDAGYRRFLSRLFVPMQKRLAPGCRGLDFGSGPAPALSRMFEEAGHRMTLFDCYYEPDSTVLDVPYDFITAAEVVEHLRDPERELQRLWTCLRDGGTLGIMTQFAVSQDAFSQWHYKNDLTHVCFFSQATFAWLADKWNADVKFPDNGVALFHKKASPSPSRDAEKVPL
jgi:hypothetical protein